MQIIAEFLSPIIQAALDRNKSNAMSDGDRRENQHHSSRSLGSVARRVG